MPQIRASLKELCETHMKDASQGFADGVLSHLVDEKNYDSDLLLAEFVRVDGLHQLSLAALIQAEDALRRARLMETALHRQSLALRDGLERLNEKAEQEWRESAVEWTEVSAILWRRGDGLELHYEARKPTNDRVYSLYTPGVKVPVGVWIITQGADYDAGQAGAYGMAFRAAMEFAQRCYPAGWEDMSDEELKAHAAGKSGA